MIREDDLHNSSWQAAASLAKARIATVHDWLTTYVGGERVLEQILALYPQADLFSSIDILANHERAFLGGRTPTTSRAQNWRLVRKHYRSFLPVLMYAIEQLDVGDYELVLSSSSAIAKGVITGPDQLHISYVHSPMRYAWDMQHQYLRDADLTRGVKATIARLILHYARQWDLRTANGVDFFAANSNFIARRIWKTYRRRSTVIYPPVAVDDFPLHEAKDDFYLTVSRMVPYKKVPAIIEAFSQMPSRKLVVIGDGSEMSKAKSVASKNVEILGYLPSPVSPPLKRRPVERQLLPLVAAALWRPLWDWAIPIPRETFSSLKAPGRLLEPWNPLSPRKIE
jgi:glycosyltransferase involved in cell wall biosynthesis